MLLAGVHVPLTTPFYPDGRLNVRKLEHNVRRYSLTPLNGLLALGSISETEFLNDEERREVLRTVAAEAAREKVLFAGIGLPGVSESVRLAEYAAGVGFDVAAVAAPTEFQHLLLRGGVASTALLTYFQAIADRSPIPVLLASDAQRSQLPVSLIAQLSEHPNVLGLLEHSSHISRVAQLREQTSSVRRTATTTVTFTAATGRMLQAQPAAEVVGATFVSAAALGGGAALATTPPAPTMKTRTKEVGFQVLWASATDATAALEAGAVGLLPALGASVPQAAFEVWAAWKDGDRTLMAEKQARLSHAEQRIAAYDVAAIKAGCELSGYFGGRPRLPLLPVTAQQQAEVLKALAGMRS